MSPWYCFILPVGDVNRQAKNHAAVERDVQCIRFRSPPVPPQEGAGGKLPPSQVPRVPRLRWSRACVQLLPSLTLKKKRDCSHAVYRQPDTVVGASLKLCSLRTGPFLLVSVLLSLRPIPFLTVNPLLSPPGGLFI